MNKYIVKNCPAIYGDEYCKESTYEDGSIHCQNCNDCVTKQVIEKCKNTCRKRCANDCLGTKKHCGYGEILQLFDIEEINK